MSERAYLVLVWAPVFALVQFIAFGAVLALDPAGFDACDLTASAGPRPIQAAVAGVAVTGSAALAIWRLRGWRLVIAVLLVALSALAWVWLLAGSQTC